MTVNATDGPLMVELDARISVDELSQALGHCGLTVVTNPLTHRLRVVTIPHFLLMAAHGDAQHRTARRRKAKQTKVST